jgi:tripartite-type tricarboxylate transporter receptor subunit TctC
MMRDIAKRALVAVCCAAGLAGFGASAQQAFPNKQIRWVVGYSAGGGSDFVARTIGQVWSEGIGQSVIVDNKPGANTAVAAADVAMARPDGYTVGFVDNGTMVLNPMLYKKLTYDPVHQFKPVTLIGRMPVILVVNANLGIDNVKQYVERAKEKPGSITYGSPGAGNALHLAMEMFNGVAGISTVHAPYRGAAPALSDLAAGHIQAMMVDLAASASFIKSGKIKALAVANGTRLQGLPDVPTFSEVGYKGFEAAALQGVVVPSATPQEVIDALNKQLVTAIRSPAVSTKLLDYGIEPAGSSAKEFADILAADKKRWQAVIEKLNIVLD